MLSALIMVISHPLVAEKQVGAVHLPNLLKIKTRPVSSPEAMGGGAPGGPVWSAVKPTPLLP